MQILTSLILVIFGIAVGLFYANSNNVKHSTITKPDCESITENSATPEELNKKKESSGVNQAEISSEKSTDTLSIQSESTESTSVNVDSSELAAVPPSNSTSKYYFSEIDRYSAEEINFESYFSKISNVDTSAKMNSIESAQRSGLIQNAIISKTIFNEITMLVENPNSLNNDPNAAANYARDLVRQWKAVDPEYVKPELLQHLRLVIGEGLKNDNPVFNELINLIGEN